LKRVIQKNVQDALAELILSGAVKDGDHVPVTAGPLGLIIGEHGVSVERAPKGAKLN
jgi:ATP-dependent Clp protease ATP-binding subunit ClpB